MNKNNEGPTTHNIKKWVGYAIKQLKNNKSPEPDNIYSEIFMLITAKNLDLFVTLLNQIYRTC